MAGWFRSQAELLVGGDGLRETAGHVGVEQAMEEVLAGFAADGKTSCDISARGETTLHGIADGHVLVLDFFADGDAFAMGLRGGGADVGEVVVENYSALIHAERKNKIRVHNTRVGVDHEVWINPEIKCVALACGTDSGFKCG